MKGGWWRRGGATELGTLGGRESRGTWNETLYERGGVSRRGQESRGRESRGRESTGDVSRQGT